MAQQTTKTRKKDRARQAFLLLMLSVVLVFGFGLIIGKQETTSGMEQSQSAQNQPPEVTEAQLDTEAVPVVVQPETTPTPVFRQATSFHSAEPQIYLRVNHTKKINIVCEHNDVNLAEAIYGVSDENIAIVDEYGLITGVSRGECTVSVFCGAETLKIPITVRELTVRDGCTYVDDILVANKQISLPETYDPGMLPETAEAFEKLQEAAAAEGLNIYQGSGYRDYQYQITCYNSLVNAYGEEYANHISAKPGHSEHQTGYTVDCNSINQTFINTPEGQWLDKHCHEFGFIIRYPEGKEAITGYDYECWHIRYVGIEHATKIYEQGLALEEYLDIVSLEDDIRPTETETTPVIYDENGYPIQVETQPMQETDALQEIPPTEVSPVETTIPVQENQVAPDAGGEFIDAPMIAP